MSEYQYYEFQAIDRPLTKAELAAVRALSTRATITPTRFQNEYHWGDFKGDPLVLMTRYYDIHVYFANWGTHQLMLRLPRQLLDSETALRYCFSDCAEVHTKGEFTILDLRSDDEEGGDWEEEGEDWMSALLPLRADLAGGDLRALYISWLSSAEAGLLDDDDSEPPVPAGLGKLSASLQTLAKFLRVSDDLLAVAAEKSGSLRERGAAAADEIARWVGTLPPAEKDALLVRAMDGEGARIGAELLRRFQVAQRAAKPGSDATATGRTVGELLAAARDHADIRRREQARRDAEAQARRERAAAAARLTYLNDLALRQEAVWQQIDKLLELKRAKEYDEATQLLIDLRDISVPRGTTEAFRARVQDLRLRHSTKRSFLDRLDRAALPR
ncbi:MAG: hypothetical protein U0232_00325 [Thermomicrobiales bacterium]